MSLLLFALRYMNLGGDPLIEREKVSEGRSRFSATLAVLLVGIFSMSICRWPCMILPFKIEKKSTVRYVA